MSGGKGLLDDLVEHDIEPTEEDLEEARQLLRARWPTEQFIREVAISRMKARMEGFEEGFNRGRLGGVK